MYVDVNITPKKQGRIGIYDGDCLKDLAKNFCRTFQLNIKMQSLLEQQLQTQLNAYLEKVGGISYIDSRPTTALQNEVDEFEEIEKQTILRYGPEAFK